MTDLLVTVSIPKSYLTARALGATRLDQVSLGLSWGSPHQGLLLTGKDKNCSKCGLPRGAKSAPVNGINDRVELFGGKRCETSDCTGK